MRKKTNKKPYIKPEIKKISLVPEEAVLTTCKVWPAGPGNPNRCIPSLRQSGS